jgi:RimJ/RimL family protein N-acetyltransferase
MQTPGIRVLHLLFTPMTETSAREVVAWRYPGLYALYNMPPEEGEEEIAILLDPRFGYYAVFDEASSLFGFCCFGTDAQVPGGDYSDDRALDVGLGIRPDLVGKGMGQDFLEAILDFAHREFDALYFRATIAQFNARSRRVFERAGFEEVQTFRSDSTNPLEFVVVARH